MAEMKRLHRMRVGHDVMDAIASNVPINCYICDYKATTKDAYNEQLY